jgi:pimeloyl-ACP methyl ester carboxylesterase
LNAPVLPNALSGSRSEFAGNNGLISYYSDAPASPANPVPLLLVHSINAAGSAYEMRPFYEHYRKQRPVYAPDLPGFGFSDRSTRVYSARLMTDAVLDMLNVIRRIHGSQPVDVMALSLASEFAARAAQERPEFFRSLAIVSPTGFDRRGPYEGRPGSNRGKEWLYRTFTFPLWRKGFFRLLTSRPSIRYFLNKTWGSKNIDEGLFEYDVLTTHQPGAENAPYYFVSGFLFSADITRVYRELKLPVFMAHGVRGDFTDYSGKRAFEGIPNWTIREYPTGALPHFEQPDALMRDYEAFLGRK